VGLKARAEWLAQEKPPTGIVGARTACPHASWVVYEAGQARQCAAQQQVEQVASGFGPRIFIASSLIAQRL
jgi:hypothetical protein